MNVDMSLIMTSFEYSGIAIWEPFNGFELTPGYVYKVHVKKHGKKTLILFVESLNTNGETRCFIAKVIAKLYKNKWRFHRKNGEKIAFNTDEMAIKLDETMAELILLG